MLPQIFHIFSTKDRDSDEIIEYRVQILPEHLFEDAIELYTRDFLPDETMCSTKKIHLSENSLKDIHKFWRHEMQKNMSLACFRNNPEGDDELVAVNVLCIKSKDDGEDYDVDVCRVNHWLEK